MHRFMQYKPNKVNVTVTKSKRYKEMVCELNRTHEVETDRKAHRQTLLHHIMRVPNIRRA